MNTVMYEPSTAPATPATRGANGHSRRLLDAIVETHAQVGDGLTDQDLTFLLRASGLPTEAGFAFLNFGNDCAVFEAPAQDPADCYPPGGWIAPEKKRLAAATAAKYRLAFDEPPDRDLDVFPRLDAPPVRHHLDQGPSLLEDLSSLYRGGAAVPILRSAAVCAAPAAGIEAAQRPATQGIGCGWSFGDTAALHKMRAAGRGAARATPPVLDRRQTEPGPRPFPVDGNLGESSRASGALREEWMHVTPSRPADHHHHTD